MSSDGLVGLSAALVALRSELLEAWSEGEGGRLRFRVAEPVELTLQVVATKEGSAEAGIKWWLVSAGGKAAVGSSFTQTLSMKLLPVMYDDDGAELDTVLIDSAR